YLDQALVLSREAHDRTNEGRVLFLQGLLYARGNQLEKAVANFQTSLAIAREERDHTYEAAVLQVVGSVCVRLGRYDVATVALDQALAVARQVKIPEIEAPILSEMMVAWSSRKQPHLAIILGKETINILQQLRGSTRTLDPILQQSFIQKNEPIYRYLANLL